MDDWRRRARHTRLRSPIDHRPGAGGAAPPTSRRGGRDPGVRRGDPGQAGPAPGPVGARRLRAAERRRLRGRVRSARAVAEELLGTVDEFNGRELAFRSLEERLDIASAAGELAFHVFGPIAHFERRLIVERTRGGPSAARTRGKVFGGPLHQDTLPFARKLIELGVRPAQAAKQLGLGRSSLYRESAALRRTAPGTPMLTAHEASPSSPS